MSAGALPEVGDVAAGHAPDSAGDRRAAAEIASLTTLRGLAAAWVVGLHLQPVLYPLLPAARVLEPFLSQGHAAVPLFFVLSGYVIGLRYAEEFRTIGVAQWLRFLLLRLGRIYPVHFVTLAASVLLVARNGWPTDAAHSPGRLVANLLLTHAWDHDFRLSWNYPSWSISSEWFAYLLFAPMAVWVVRLGRGGLLGLTFAAAGASAAAVAFADALAFRGLALVAPTFLGGLALAQVCPPATAPHAWWRRGGAEAILLAGIVGSLVAPDASAAAAVWIVVSFAVVAVLGVAGHRASALWRWRPLVHLGTVSYSLYMTHALAITLATRVLPLDRILSTGPAVRLATFLGIAAAIWLASVLCYALCERPSRRLSRWLLRPAERFGVDGSPRDGWRDGWSRGS